MMEREWNTRPRRDWAPPPRRERGPFIRPNREPELRQDRQPRSKPDGNFTSQRGRSPGPRGNMRPIPRHNRNPMPRREVGPIPRQDWSPVPRQELGHMPRQEVSPLPRRETVRTSTRAEKLSYHNTGRPDKGGVSPSLVERSSEVIMVRLLYRGKQLTRELSTSLKFKELLETFKSAFNITECITISYFNIKTKTTVKISNKKKFLESLKFSGTNPSLNITTEVKRDFSPPSPNTEREWELAKTTEVTKEPTQNQLNTTRLETSTEETNQPPSELNNTTSKKLRTVSPYPTLQKTLGSLSLPSVYQSKKTSTENFVQSSKLPSSTTLSEVNPTSHHIDSTNLTHPNSTSSPTSSSDSEQNGSTVHPSPNRPPTQEPYSYPTHHPHPFLEQPSYQPPYMGFPQHSAPPIYQNSHYTNYPTSQPIEFHPSYLHQSYPYPFPSALDSHSDPTQLLSYFANTESGINVTYQANDPSMMSSHHLNSNTQVSLPSMNHPTTVSPIHDPPYPKPVPTTTQPPPPNSHRTLTSDVINVPTDLTPTRPPPPSTADQYNQKGSSVLAIVNKYHTALSNHSTLDILSELLLDQILDGAKVDLNLLERSLQRFKVISEAQVMTSHRPLPVSHPATSHSNLEPSSRDAILDLTEE